MGGSKGGLWWTIAFAPFPPFRKSPRRWCSSDQATYSVGTSRSQANASVTRRRHCDGAPPRAKCVRVSPGNASQLRGVGDPQTNIICAVLIGGAKPDFGMNHWPLFIIRVRDIDLILTR